MQSTKKRIGSALLIFSCFLALAALLGACNNGDKDDKKMEAKDSDSTINADTAAQRKVVYTVRLTHDKFVNLFNNDNDIKMIYFEFDGSRYSGGYSLRAFGADKNGQPVGSMDIDLDTVGHGSTIPYNGGTVVPDYSVTFTRGNVKDFFGLTTGTDTRIDEKDLTEVWLTPCAPDAAGHISYMVTKPSDPVPVCTGIRANSRGLIFANPSPPGNPCGAECDNAAFVIQFNKK